MTMSTVRRRAAAPPADPYLELELFLEKVNEEIGKVFSQCLSEDGYTNTNGNDDEDYDNNENETILSDNDKRSSTSTSLSLSYSFDLALPNADYYGSVNTATQTSPTISQSSSPVWVSDCSSSFALHSSSSSSEHGDYAETSSPENVVQQNFISSDSELLPMFRTSKKRNRSGMCPGASLQFIQNYGSSDDNSVNTIPALFSTPAPAPATAPVWILRQDVKQLKRHVHAHTELCNKSSSAPILKKSDNSSSHIAKVQVTKQSRSQSDRHLAEIQAADACKWLRAAGFPQYAQMYEEHQFPVDLNAVENDHPLLDADSKQALFRRLCTLNSCANIKIDTWRTNQQDDSDTDDNQCALSENWTFQHDQRRWSRCIANDLLQPVQNVAPETSDNSKCGLEDNGSATASVDIATPHVSSASTSHAVEEETASARSGSDRLKDTAKAFIRRVESLKTRRPKRQNREGIVISGPHEADVLSMQQKMKDLSCMGAAGPALSADNSFEYANSPQSSPLPCSPAPSSPRRPIISMPIFSSSDIVIKKMLTSRRSSVSFDRVRDAAVEVFSDSDCQRKFKTLNTSRIAKSSARKLHRSHTSVHSSDYDSDVEEADVHNQFRASWHSLQRGRLSVLHPEEPTPMVSLTSGQLQVLRKLALLKLTALIEKHCPTHKTSWNFEFPKFIRKMKTPDYKDKSVFGVPLSVMLQRTGQPLPKSMQEALRWLLVNAKDQVGLFRKSGVRSRIQQLKGNIESRGAYITFDEQQAYDVADVVKQYFRELPESLLTAEYSGILTLIFQHVPAILREEAVQYVLLLIPNEHCEVLQTLLEFLQHVSNNSSSNQMTASNLALCFAPSLFCYNQNLSICNGSIRQNAMSPLKKKPTGAPDQKELFENKAAHDCLLYFINNYNTLFTISKDMLKQCCFSDMDESKPLTLLELGTDQHQDWRGYLNQCQNALFKESKEKSRGWISSGHGGEVDVWFKKVGDGHPLRLWRIVTEVEAPPREVLHRVLRERHIWDPTLTKMRVIESLDEQAEVFQYACENMHPLASRDYCILRSWRSDLTRGACVIVETSVDHEGAELIKGSIPWIRGIILASRYLIEPCGSGKSRLVHLSRMDTMGRSPEWYHKNYGHLCRMHLANIRGSFKHLAKGPESKV